MGKELRKVFREVATFQRGASLPHFEAMGSWGETIARWHREGLPEDKNAYEYFQIDRFMDNEPEPLRYLTDNVCEPCYWPPFEKKEIEEDEKYAIIRDTDGVIKKVNKMDESMPQFLKFPVENRQDWEKIRWRLNPEIEERYKHTEEVVSSLKNHEEILRFGVCGSYGFPRRLFGMERLAYIYYDDPKLLHEIMEQWLYLYTGMADKLCPLVEFDYVFIWEDMAYKTGPLISPKLFQKFISPYYKQFINHMRKAHKIELFMVDSDGNNFDILPLFTEAGVNIFIPCEITAGMDPIEIRRRHPQLALLGGIDKRVLVKGKKDIEEEMARKVPSMLESGGYFPSLDHHVPADIPFENFCYYIEVLRKIEGN